MVSAVSASAWAPEQTRALSTTNTVRLKNRWGTTPRAGSTPAFRTQSRKTVCTSLKTPCIRALGHYSVTLGQESVPKSRSMRSAASRCMSCVTCE